MCRLWARGSLRHEPGLRGHQHHGGPQQQDVRAQVEVRGSPPGGFEFVGSSVFFSQEWYKPGPENLVALSLLFYLFLHTVSNFLLWIFLSITPLSPFFFSTITHTTDTHTHIYKLDGDMGDAQRLVLLRAYDVCYVYVAYVCTGTSYNTQYRKMFVSVGNVRKGEIR